LPRQGWVRENAIRRTGAGHRCYRSDIERRICAFRRSYPPEPLARTGLGRGQLSRDGLAQLEEGNERADRRHSAIEIAPTARFVKMGGPLTRAAFCRTA